MTSHAPIRSQTPRRRRMPIRAALGSALVPLLAGCHVVSRLDYGHLLSRQGWQRTDRVIETLALAPGDHVADLGAGDGYFSFRFAEAVGSGGRVYAVEVDPGKVAALRREVAERGASNIEVVLADPDDPRLPDGSIDLAFFCNAYHHFEERVSYLRSLRSDLSEHARIAIIDSKPEGSVFIPKGHILPEGQIRAELSEAGYRHSAGYDFLPIQSFDVFTVQ